MGNIVCTLTAMYCRAGCKASVIASALTFHPPSPYYSYNDEGCVEENDVAEYHDGLEADRKVILDKDFQRKHIQFDTDLGEIPGSMRDTFSTYLITTTNNTKVPIILFETENAYFTMIVSHGNASDMGSMLPFYALCHSALKVNIIGYDYTGYGESMKYDIRPTEEQTYNDIEAVYDWACKYKNGKLIPSGDPSKHILLYGQSVGSGPSTYIAGNQSVNISPIQNKENDEKKTGNCMCNSQSNFNRRRVAGLILHSPIMSGLRVLTDDRFLWCCDIYPNINRIEFVSSPVMIIHGEKDVEVKLSHGKLLQNAVPNKHRAKPWWVSDRGHNDLLVDNEDEFILRVREFLLNVKRKQKEIEISVNIEI